MYTLENGRLRIEIHPRGAELRSMYDKNKDRELIWQRDTVFWEKSSPVLFPFIGESRGGSYRYENTTYQMPKHGFARDYEFEVVHHTEDEVSFLLCSNEFTLAVYPFEFKLYLHYKLHHTRLSCTYEVWTQGNQEMLFSIGGHPAFQLDFSASNGLLDYYLEFPEDKMLTRYSLNEGLLRVQPQSVSLENGRLYLKGDMFMNDAWVLKDLCSTEVHLKNQDDDYHIRLRFVDFPYLGLWAPVGAPFLCLEPWCGVNDLETHTGELEKKEGIVRLDAFTCWERTWDVTIGES